MGCRLGEAVWGEIGLNKATTARRGQCDGTKR